jgi:hypothetical protein
LSGIARNSRRGYFAFCDGGSHHHSVRSGVGLRDRAGVSQCLSTPPATTIKLNAAATLLAPSIGADAADHHADPVSCGHEGAAAAVATGSATLAVTGSVTSPWQAYPR